MNQYFFKKLHFSLPIFEIPWGERFIMYTPGKILVFNSNEKEIFHRQLTDENNPQLIFTNYKAAELIQRANEVKTFWDTIQKNEFNPECLTVYPGNDCNLNCRYCYSRMNAIKGKNITVNIDAVLLAARWVVSNCLKKESPFIFVAHGGGEPTFHWELLTKLTKKVRQVADDAGIGFFSYIATNGNLEQDKVTWLVQNFNLIGLSCDGPVEQNQFQRNGSLNRILKKTARTILEEGGKFDVRSTISRTQIFKQTTIVEYLVDELQAKRIRLEPEYLNQNDPFTVDDARPFIDNFIKASEMAESKGSKVEYSGVRINEIHSSFCDINRNTLRINPQNQFINCFCDVDNQRYPFGTVNFSTNQIELTNFEDLKKKPFDLRPECGNCINVYHCSRGCPDHCVHRDERLNGFKCKLNAELAVELIKKQASWMYGD